MMVVLCLHDEEQDVTFFCDLVLVKNPFYFFKEKNRTPLKVELEKRKTFQVCLEGMRDIC
jgi:hypothetical protein